VSGKQVFTFYAAKLRLLFELSKVFVAFSWWFIKKRVVLRWQIFSINKGIDF